MVATAAVKLPSRTQAAIRQDEARTQRAVAQVVALLSLSPEGSPCHNVTALYDGLYVPVKLFPNKQVNVYALPWSRGWSIFADDAPPPGQPLPGAHDWRYVKSQYRGLQRPLYCPRDLTGPRYIPAATVTGNLVEVVEHLVRLDKARRARFRKKYWYFANSLERKKGGPNQP